MNRFFYGIGVQESILDLFLKAIELLKNKPTEYQLLLGALRRPNDCSGTVK